MDAASSGSCRSCATGLWRTCRSLNDQPTISATGTMFFFNTLDSHFPLAPNNVNPSTRPASLRSASKSWLPATAKTSIPAPSSRPTHSSSGGIASNLALVLSTTSPANRTASTSCLIAKSVESFSAAAGVSSLGSIPEDETTSGTPEQLVPRWTSPIARILAASSILFAKGLCCWSRLPYAAVVVDTQLTYSQ